MTTPRPRRITTAVWLLIAISVLGVLELFTSATIIGESRPLTWLDVTVYACLAIMACGILKRMNLAKILYLILAIVWYIVAIFYLPFKYGHDLNAGLIFIQIILTLAAYYMLFQPKSRQWFK